MSSFWEGMWGVVQATCSELDFDFLGYADEYLGKVARASTTPTPALARGSPCRLTCRTARAA